MRRPTRSRSHGFSLIETLVATTVLTVGVLGLAQLIVAAATANHAARATTTATILARSKMEELRAAPWDTLANSPPDALRIDTPGFVDYLDAEGSSLAGRAGAAFVRRWSIEPLASDAANGVVLQVLVETTAKYGGQTRLFGIRTRWW